MTFIIVKLTAREVELLAALASDQLFRREFIDRKMPGYRCNPEDLGLGRKLVDVCGSWRSGQTEHLQGETERLLRCPCTTAARKIQDAF
jgi:hypothetical protein